jgi:hypothetical protein
MKNDLVPPSIDELFNRQLPGAPVPPPNQNGNAIIYIFVGIVIGVTIYYVIQRAQSSHINNSNKD